jgi:hypothetical protein
MNKIEKFLEYRDKRNHDIKILIEQFEKSKYIKIIEKSFNNSIENKNNLPEWILNMEGMSGISYRCFINYLIGHLNDPKYLEIGCWKGSTCCSAIYNNSAKVLCIDNWSEFGGPKNDFFYNVKKCIDENQNVLDFEFIEKDFKNINFNNIGKYNIYMFDGPHEEQDHYDSLSIVKDSLEDEFIFICDDWNWEEVRRGTKKSFKDSEIKILYSLTIFTSLNGGMPIIENSIQNSHWHNGYFIAICKK